MDRDDHCPISTNKAKRPESCAPPGKKKDEKSRLSFKTASICQNSQSPLISIRSLCRQFSGLDFGDFFLSKKSLLFHASTSATGISSGSSLDFTHLVPLERALKPRNMSLNQRMTLGLNVVSSVMQLNSTHWLDLPLNIRMIHLILNGPMTPATSIQPLIKHKFTCDTGKKSGSNVRSTMLELGIILLELWQEQTFTSFIADSQISASNTVGFWYDAACQWADESIDHIMPFYHDVVKRCVECNFATSPGGSAEFDWNDLTFRRSVCEHVFQPLWEECRLI